MKIDAKQQLVISGVGGQGVLLVTRLLAEAAMKNGYPVFTSETHGMAQRGGIVVSHLKVGEYFSPMIRAGRADGLIALKDETLAPFLPLVGPGGWVVVNQDDAMATTEKRMSRHLAADRIALAAGYPRSVNLVMLGFALSVMEKHLPGAGICSIADIRDVMKTRLQEKPKMFAQGLSALEAGYEAGGGITGQTAF